MISIIIQRQLSPREVANATLTPTFLDRVYLHGIVMMFAFTYLMAQGITLVRVCPSSRRCAKITHSIFNTLSLLFGIAGLILIVSYKSRNNVRGFFLWDIATFFNF